MKYLTILKMRWSESESESESEYKCNCGSNYTCTPYDSTISLESLATCKQASSVNETLGG